MSTFAVKQPAKVLWSREYWIEDIREQLKMRKIDEDYLICPFGEAIRAVPLSLFLKDEQVFKRMVTAEVEAKAQVEKPPARIWGKWLIGIFVTALVIGRIVVRVFFPGQIGAGIGSAQLLILVPIWTIGALGLSFWTIGYWQQEARVKLAMADARRDVIALASSEQESTDP